MTDEQKQILISIGAEEKDFDNYYFDKDGNLFTPLNDKGGNMLKTGEQVYNEWIEMQKNPPKPQLTETEILKKQLLETQKLIAQLQYNNLLNTK